MSTYLIIGASSGIGQALSTQLCSEGHTVYATYCKNKPESFDSQLHYNYLNVLDENISFDYLPDTIQGLVYCPGTINLKPFERIKPIDFANDYNLQVIGAVKIIQAVLPKLKKVENASIVLYSTVAVQLGLNYHSQVSASKGAIEGLTKALAAEYAPTVRVNCVAPSLTDTPLAASLLNSEQKREINAQKHPMKRIGNVADIAGITAFLLSDKASWITGQTIHVDGGLGSLKV